jgi:cobalt/nickel transport system ATP-binding protein
MSHHIIEVKNLHHSYPDGTVALKDISLRISHGESVALIGANGAGKSTLLQHLNGALTTARGSVTIGDFPINRQTLARIRRTVGMVFQNPDDQLFMPTVYDDVAFGPFNLGLRGEDLEQKVAAALTAVGAEALRNKPPYNLSGGEKKRVAIATVLAMSPDILAMDEPTSGLDPYARRQVISLLQGFQHTKIITSHDLDLVLELCPRIVILHEGEIAADGSALELFNDVRLLERCHLEQPLSMQGCGYCRLRAPSALP